MTAPELSTKDLRLLYQLSRGPQHRLVEELGVFRDRSERSASLLRLLLNGYVARFSPGTRLRFLYSVTDRGRAVLADAHRAVHHRDRAVAKHFFRRMRQALSQSV